MRFDDVLLALIAQKPMSGYDAKKWLDTEGIFMRANADQSQIYRTLHRLRRADLVEHVRETRAAGPDAKVYSASPAGIEHLLALAREPFEPEPRWQEPDFMARFTMLGPLAPDTIPELIRTELQFRRAQVVRFRGRERGLDLSRAALPIDPAIAEQIRESSHTIGSAGADQWIAWLEAQLDLWLRSLKDQDQARRAAIRM